MAVPVVVRLERVEAEHQQPARARLQQDEKENQELLRKIVATLEKMVGPAPPVTPGPPPGGP